VVARKLTRIVGPHSYEIQLKDGSLIRRHTDSIQKWLTDVVDDSVPSDESIYIDLLPVLPSAAELNKEASQVELSVPTGTSAVASPRDPELPETSPVSDNPVNPQQSSSPHFLSSSDVPT